MIIRHACGHEGEYDDVSRAGEFCDHCKKLGAMMEAPLGKSALALGCAMGSTRII